ncbi:MAG: UDP-N-acetylmuramoyl-L-alanyl-D-glutamate--2,6-diaminopimelate ligase [Chlamydiae bacterium]|nr:UDP-N-acetylmuramoyl-L-alanyl-D-glutamate--2,6-diaminopimelate ligase [Chlamydiota bacterium]
MKLKKLLKDIPILEVRGPKEVEITGVCANSKFLAPGNLFVAKKGRTVEGAQYIPEAIAAGAVAILTDIFDPTLKNVTQIIHPDVSKIEGLIAAQYNQFPSEELLMVAITGTNGKTTTSFLIKHLLGKYYGPCGLIGTIEYIIGEHRYRATHTTPDVSINYKLLREMINEGCSSAIMEVTSHALDQGRVSGIQYDVVIFTNLTPEHLDYHSSMDEYCQVKNKIFRDLNPDKKKKGYQKTAIVNADDPYHKKILQGCRVPVVTYGIDSVADLQATDIRLNAGGTKYLLRYQDEVYPIKLPLIGRFNVYNSLATIACGISQGIPLENISKIIRSFPPVPGRLELVPNKLGLNIYVDFAHTPDALANALKTLRELNSGRIITLFGCGGDRDRLKRPNMAEVCEQFSDICVVTTDNPRSEDPEAIISDITKGFQKASSYVVEIDRRTAMEKTLHLATPEDIILIAGRGHEPYQTFPHHTLEFDDRKVATEICQNISQKGTP